LERVQSQVKREELQDDVEKLSYDLYVQQLTDYVTLTPKHKTYLCCINRMEGPHMDLPMIIGMIPLKKTTKMREFYRDLLQAIPKQMDEVIILLQTGLKEGRTPAQISMGGVVEHIRKMLEEKLPKFTKPMEGDTFPEAEKPLFDECMKLIEGPVTGAYTKLADFLEKEYIPNLRTEISAGKGYPDGENYYKSCLSFHTTTSMTPEEIHQLGLDEVQRVQAEMLEIAKTEGFDELPAFLKHAREAPGYSPTSPDALVAHYRNIIGKMAPELLKLFHLDTLPRLPLAVSEIDVPTMPAAFYHPGSANRTNPRQGIFYCNVSSLESRRLYDCEALALHEATPGHHTQIAIQSEMSDLPEFRRNIEDRRYFEAPCRFPFYTGYIEGWGLHAETLGPELGLYKRPIDKFGQLSCEAFRSCRLVVDTGMHALGWSFDQALQYMLENTAMDANDLRVEVTRYVTWPGQATAYKVGERVIRKLRTLSETELGDKFDPRDFYDVVLKGGALPLDVLERLVKEYIEKTKTDTQPGSSRGNTQDDFLESMTFASLCKCCVVPGSCQTDGA